MKTFETSSLKQAWKALCFLFLMLAMISGSLAQETEYREETDFIKTEPLKENLSSPDKSSGYRLNVVGSDALIHGLTIGRGGGSISTNTALGWGALLSNTTGNRNTASGHYALYSNTTGYRNIAIGNYALFSNTSAISNIAIGYQALYKNMYYNLNLAIGNTALYNITSGGGNTSIGHSSLYKLENGDQNTSIGYRAMYGITGGTCNTAIGYDSGHENSLYTSMSTFIGANARPQLFGSDPTLEWYNVTCIGYNARVGNMVNAVRIGNSSVTSIGGYASWTKYSDGSYKFNVEDEVAGLDFIMKLRPVSYNLDVHKLAADLGEDIIWDAEGNKCMSTPDEITLKSRNEKAAIRYTGFIAQEVEAAVNELGVAFSGVDAPTNKESHYGLRYADFVVPLVKAVQEQQVQIELLEPAAVEALQQELQELTRINVEIQKRLENVEAENEIIKDQLSQILSLLKEQGVDLGGINTSDPTRPGGDRSGRNTTTQEAYLEQNTPNPFYENTVVRYFVPENSGMAKIVVTDLQGNRIQTLNVNSSGYGQVTIRGGSLPAGTYVYSLLINGQLYDSKRMVLL